MAAFNLTPGAAAIVFPPLARAAGAPPSAHAAKQSAAVAIATSRTPIRPIKPLLDMHVARETRANDTTPPASLVFRRGRRLPPLKVRSGRHSGLHNGPPMRSKLAIAPVAAVVLMAGCGGSK